MFRRVVRGTKCLSLAIIPMPFTYFRGNVVNMVLPGEIDVNIRTPWYLTYVLRSRDIHRSELLSSILRFTSRYT